MTRAMRVAAAMICCSAAAGYIFAQQPAQIPTDIKVLLDRHVCSTCHKLDGKLIGPSYMELSQKGQSVKTVQALIYEPKPENWPGYPPMAPMPHLPKDDVKKIAEWIVSLRG